MLRIVMKSRVSTDGVLHLDVPMGEREANRDVQVTVEPLVAGESMTPEEWRSWVQSLAGSWQGEFERPAQGDFEEREPLS